MIMLPAPSYVGSTQLAPVVAVIAVISLTSLWVRSWTRSSVVSPSVSSSNALQLLSWSRSQSCANASVVIAEWPALMSPRSYAVSRFRPS